MAPQNQHGNMVAQNQHPQIPPPPPPHMVNGPPQGGPMMAGGQQQGMNQNRQMPPMPPPPGGHGMPMHGMAPFNPGMIQGGPMQQGMPHPGIPHHGMVNPGMQHPHMPGMFPNQPFGPTILDQAVIYEAHEIRRKKPLSGQKPTWKDTDSVKLKFEAETVLKNARKTRSDHSVYNIYRNLRSDSMRSAVDEVVERRNREEYSQWHEWQMHHIDLSVKPLKAGIARGSEVVAVTVIMRRVIKQEWSQTTGMSSITDTTGLKKENVPVALTQLQQQMAALQINQHQVQHQVQMTQQQQFMNQQAAMRQNPPITIYNTNPNKNAKDKDKDKDKDGKNRGRSRSRSQSPLSKFKNWKFDKLPPRSGNMKGGQRSPTPGLRKDSTRRRSVRKYHRGKDGSSDEESYEWIDHDSLDGHSRAASSIDSDEIRYRRSQRRRKAGWYDEDDDYLRKGGGRYASARSSRQEVRRIRGSSFSPPFRGALSPDRGYGRRSSKTLAFSRSRPDSPSRPVVENHTHYHYEKSGPSSPRDFDSAMVRKSLAPRHNSYSAPSPIPYAPMPPLDRRQTDASRYMDERRAYRAGRRDAENDLMSLETSSLNTWDDIEDQVRVKRAGLARKLDELDLRHEREWNGLPPDRRRL